MALLTLSPSRFATSNTFEDNSWAYAVADKPVRKLGVLVTPTPIQAQAVNGAMTFELTPNEEVDEAIQFTYTIAAYGPNGILIYKHGIVMPATDSLLFDLVPVEQDLDSCVTTTLTDNS